MSALLAGRQRWLYGAITAAAAPRRPQRVLGGAAVPAELGLAVYRHAYRARLRECIEDDFTAVARVLGEGAFSRLADAFVVAHPPCDATLNAYGRFFPPWLATSRVAGRVRLAELARLEWALVEALHAPLAPTLDGDQLAGVAPHAWGGIRLRVMPSLRLITCRFATNALYQAFQDARPLPGAQRRSGGVAVLRGPDGLRRHQLDALETRVLARLLAESTLAEALAGIPARHLPTIQQAFSRWIAQGFFTALG